MRAATATFDDRPLPVRITTEDGKVISADEKSGHVFWEPAVTHSVENISGRPMRAYMVEIKDKDWKASTG